MALLDITNITGGNDGFLYRKNTQCLGMIKLLVMLFSFKLIFSQVLPQRSNWWGYYSFF